MAYMFLPFLNYAYLSDFLCDYFRAYYADDIPEDEIVNEENARLVFKQMLENLIYYIYYLRSISKISFFAQERRRRCSP